MESSKSAVASRWKFGAVAAQRRFDFLIREFRSQAARRAWRPPWAGTVTGIRVGLRVPGRQGGAQRASGIAGGGLDPDSLENAFAQEAPVGHAIERHAARQAKMLFAGQFPRVAGQAQHDFLRHGLDGAGGVHVALLDGFLRAPRRPAEQAGESGRWSWSCRAEN